MTEPQPPTDKAVSRADRAIGGAMAFAAVRCTVQYILLPFVLPWFGLTGAFSAALSLVIEVLALGLIVYNLKQLWRTNWRWRYLGLSAVMISVMGVFAYVDILALM